MSWNYRVVKMQYGDHCSFGIHEAFYNNDNSIHSYTEDPVDVYAESLEGLRDTLEQMLRALDKPVLVDGKVEFSDNK